MNSYISSLVGLLLRFTLISTIFKPFNDYYGYARGDQLLRFFADIILSSVKRFSDFRSSFVGHIGGDDFVILTRHECAREISEHIIKVLQDHILQSL
jgi:diguanylate cyclase (GGDEF)-like protein